MIPEAVNRCARSYGLCMTWSPTKRLGQNEAKEACLTHGVTEAMVVACPSASEALRLGQRFGLSPDFILRTHHEGGRTDLGAVLREEVLTRRFQSGRSLGMIRGNIELAAKLAASLKISSPMLEATKTAWSEADAQLGSGADHTAVIRWLESLQMPEDTVEQSEAVEGAAEA